MTDQGKFRFESGEGVRLPRERADLRGSAGNFSGEVRETFPGKSGKLPGNLWKNAVKFHSERTSGEVAEKLPGKSPGNFRGSPGTFQKLGGAWLPPSDSPNLSPNWQAERDAAQAAVQGMQKASDRLTQDLPLPYPLTQNYYLRK